MKSIIGVSFVSNDNWSIQLYGVSDHANETHFKYHSALNYRQVSNIRRTKSQHLKDSHSVLRLSFPNPLKPDDKSRMKI